MPMKVMISSVRRGGLGPVRDSVRPVIEILGYKPIRFEDMTSQPVPSRAACVDMVKGSDLYLLLLGAEYGDEMDETGLAPTAEEWTIARNEGKPIVVFKHSGITPEPRQADFIREVESYSTGVFRATFTDTGDLLGKLKEALATAAVTIQPMRPRRLTEVVQVPWRQDDRGFGSGGIVMETHVAPVGNVDQLRVSGFQDLSRRLARAGRDHGLFEEGEALALPTSERGVAAQVDAGGRRPEAGLSITPERIITVWQALPSVVYGAVFDEDQVSQRIARDVRLAAGLDLLACEEVAIAVGINRVEMLGEVTGPNSMTFPFAGSAAGAARMEPTEAFATGALPRIAPEVGSELAARLSLRLRQR
jgi:Domain of unknown function (DUF4062)